MKLLLFKKLKATSLPSGSGLSWDGRPTALQPLEISFITHLSSSCWGHWIMIAGASFMQELQLCLHSDIFFSAKRKTYIFFSYVYRKWDLFIHISFKIIHDHLTDRFSWRELKPRTNFMGNCMCLGVSDLTSLCLFPNEKLENWSKALFQFSHSITATETKSSTANCIFPA